MDRYLVSIPMNSTITETVTALIYHLQSFLGSTIYRWLLALQCQYSVVKTSVKLHHILPSRTQPPYCFPSACLAALNLSSSLTSPLTSSTATSVSNTLPTPVLQSRSSASTSPRTSSWRALRAMFTRSTSPLAPASSASSARSSASSW